MRRRRADGKRGAPPGPARAGRTQGGSQGGQGLAPDSRAAGLELAQVERVGHVM